ncbi:MAG: hypothetical protein GQE15_34915, partial [Archangiaceae bacterium]|nr:hypothetical protein [Archangiaceae bacterium]
PLLVRTALEWLSTHKVTVFTTELAAMMQQVEDPALSARLAEMGPNLTTAMRFVGRRQAKVIVALAETAASWHEPPLSTAEAAALDAFEGSAKPAPAGDTASLFAKVYAAPGDDSLRALLADALVATGDPRGEFISMQLLRGDAAPSKAEKKLEAEWRDAWLGRLAPCFRKGVVFRRGFPAEGAYEKSGDPTWPEWATFEALDLMPASGFVTGGTGILVKAPLKALRKVTRIGRPVLDEEEGEPSFFELDDLPWHTVGFQCVEAFVDALPKLLTARRFPKVHTFHLDTPPGWYPPSDALLAPLLKLRWFTQVKHLEVALGPGALATALTAKVESLVLKDHAGLSRRVPRVGGEARARRRSHRTTLARPARRVGAGAARHEARPRLPRAAPLQARGLGGDCQCVQEGRPRAAAHAARAPRPRAPRLAGAMTRVTNGGDAVAPITTLVGYVRPLQGVAACVICSSSCPSRSSAPRPASAEARATSVKPRTAAPASSATRRRAAACSTPPARAAG